MKQEPAVESMEAVILHRFQTTMGLHGAELDIPR